MTPYCLTLTFSLLDFKAWQTEAIEYLAMNMDWEDNVAQMFLENRNKYNKWKMIEMFLRNVVIKRGKKKKKTPLLSCLSQEVGFLENKIWAFVRI